jgi:hypothetical protein
MSGLAGIPNRPCLDPKAHHPRARKNNHKHDQDGINGRIFDYVGNVVKIKLHRRPQMPFI